MWKPGALCKNTPLKRRNKNHKYLLNLLTHFPRFLPWLSLKIIVKFDCSYNLTVPLLINIVNLINVPLFLLTLDPLSHISWKKRNLMFNCMWICIRMWICICMCVCMWIFTCTFMCNCICIYICILYEDATSEPPLSTSPCMCMCVCMWIYLYV